MYGSAIEVSACLRIAPSRRHSARCERTTEIARVVADFGWHASLLLRLFRQAMVWSFDAIKVTVQV